MLRPTPAALCIRVQTVTQSNASAQVATQGQETHLQGKASNVTEVKTKRKECGRNKFRRETKAKINIPPSLIV